MSIRIKDWDVVRAKKNGRDVWILQGYCFGIPGLYKGFHLKALVKEVRLIRIGFMVRCRIWFYCECVDRKKGRDSAFDDEGFWF